MEYSTESEEESTESDSEDDDIMQSIKLNEPRECQRKLIEEISSEEMK